MMKRIAVLAVLVVALAGVAAAEPANIQIEKMMAEPEPLQTGQYANVWFKVVNNGSAEAEDVNISVRDEFPFTVRDDTDDSWFIREIEDGESYSFRVQLLVDRSAVSGEEELTFWVEKDGTDAQRTHRIPLDVRDDDTALIVDAVDFPERVSPGSTQEMTVTLENLANTQFQNIDIRLDLEDQIPVAVADASRQRVQRLDAGETVDVTYRVFVDEEADRGVYRLPITLAYENVAGNDFTQEQMTGVVVGGVSNVNVAVERTDINTDGMRGDVTLRVVNRGEGQAKFVSVGVDDTEEAVEVLSTNDIYIGNMIPDDFQTAEFDLFVEEQEDDLHLPVAVEYVDASGQQVKETQEVTLRLYDDELMDRYGLVEDQDMVLFAGVIVALLLLAGGVYWRRRRAG